MWKEIRCLSKWILAGILRCRFSFSFSLCNLLNIVIFCNRRLNYFNSKRNPNIIFCMFLDAFSLGFFIISLLWCMRADIRDACQKRQEPFKNTQKSFSFQVIQSSRLLNWNKIKDCRFLPVLLAVASIHIHIDI